MRTIVGEQLFPGAIAFAGPAQEMGSAAHDTGVAQQGLVRDWRYRLFERGLSFNLFYHSKVIC